MSATMARSWEQDLSEREQRGLALLRRVGCDLCVDDVPTSAPGTAAWDVQAIWFDGYGDAHVFMERRVAHCSAAVSEMVDAAIRLTPCAVRHCC